MKIYKGLFDNLYKKWELYLIRLFQISKTVENLIKWRNISGPSIEEILDDNGCTNFFKIGPNPFLIDEEESEIFYMVFEDDLVCKSETEKNLRKLHKEIWDRINNLKTYLGIIKNTRFRGEIISERRLVNEIDVYIKFPRACNFSLLHKLMFGEHPTNKKEKEEFIEELEMYQNFLKDREIADTVKSYQNYI